MAKMNLTDELVQAKVKHFAVPAFNIFNYTSSAAVIAAAEVGNVPVILQTSPGTVKYYGAQKLSNLIQVLKKMSNTNVYLHLDHCTSVELAKECMDCGWDSIMFDGSNLPIEENIRLSRQVVQYAHLRGITVEGELGTIVGVEEEVKVDKAKLASVEECRQYVQQSGIDYFAPAVGTAHGLYNGEPHINFDLVEKLSELIPQPIVIHGGSGLAADVFRKLIRKGAAKINISTALKEAYFKGCRRYMEKFPDKVSPLDLDGTMFQAIKEAAGYHIAIFKG